MKTVYTEGKYHSASQNNVSSMMQAFNYGTAAFEGMKAYYHTDEKKWSIYRPDQYYQRLLKSCSMIDIELGLTFDQFVGIISKLIKKNDLRSHVYIRPLAYRSEKGVGLTRPSSCGVSIFVQGLPHKSGNQFRCCFVPQRRPVDGSYSGKLTGNYLLSYLSHKSAQKRGFDVGILNSSENYLSEASIMNLFFVRAGKLFTPSLECGALAGITRRSVLQLAQEVLGLKVSEGKYRQSSLLEATEVFFTGTGSGVNYVKQVEKKKYSLSQKNRLAVELDKVLTSVCSGKESRYADWLVEVK